MTYSNASPLMVHGKNQQGLRWLQLSVSVVVQGAAGRKTMPVQGLRRVVVEVRFLECHSLLKV